MQKTKLTKDLENKIITVTREITAPVEKVWRAHTDKDLLAQWWSPAPWTLETKIMDFRVGGFWLYAMVSPENLKHWSKVNYTLIELYKRIDAFDFFCDENGKPNEKMPAGKGSFVFTKTNSGTQVEMIQVFETVEALNQTLEMGFQQGITACYEQLDKLLEK